MTHIRTSIRTALAQRLAASAPTGWTIERSRDRHVDIAEMPVLLLGVRREIALPDGGCLPARRDLSVELCAHLTVSREADIEDALDAASVWIERALEADPALGGLARDTVYRGAEIELITGGERPAGRIALSFDIRVSASAEGF